VIVAPFFPPSALPPSHRARLFVRHLPAFGWTPIVITVDARDREEPPEPVLETTVAATVRVERVRALSPRVTRRFGVGDLALRALPALAARTVRVAREQQGAVVLLVVPPWYVLWLAPLIRRFGRGRVVVDYVDPWRVGGRTIKSRLAAWVAARSEGWSVRHIAGVFAVSDGIVADLRRQFPWLRDVPAASAGYGFEQSDLQLIGRSTQRSDGQPPRAPAADAALFRLIYVGAISDSQLPVLESLLDAILEIRRRAPLAADRLRLELYGTTYAAPDRARARTTELVAARGLGQVVRERPERVPYTEALALAAQADANLVLGDLTTYYAASKLMPLLAAQRPMLALLHGDTEPAAVLRRLGAAGLVCYATADLPSPNAAVPAMADVLLALLAGRVPILAPQFEADPSLRERTAERMTAALADLLDRASGAERGTP
jgi:hypothetical protein